MRLLADTRKTVQKWREMERKVIDITELGSLVSDDEKSSLDVEIRQEIDAIGVSLDEMEFELAFNGEYDNRKAILSIHAGAGGVESQDWAEMLLRMYLRWAESKKYNTEILDISPGEEAGIKNVVLEISHEYAFGYMKSEHGVHRLVRLSPFDADHARHTSFALGEVMPEAGRMSMYKYHLTTSKWKHSGLQARAGEYAEDQQRRSYNAHTQRHGGKLSERAFPTPE
jgi:peptide chain release factor 2